MWAQLVRDLIIFPAVLLCFGQAPQLSNAEQRDSAQPQAGSAAGRILDADTGQPVSESLLVDAQNNASGLAQGTPVEGVGRYSVEKLPPGRYLIRAYERDNRFPIGSRSVSVESGVKTSGVDVYVRFTGRIFGLVLDDDRQPVAGARVGLISTEYWFGRLAYGIAGSEKTDQNGEFRFGRKVPAGRSYVVLALPPSARVESKATADGAQSAPVMEPAWFPAPPVDGGYAGLVLRSGEQKRVELRLTRSASHCIDGVLTADGHPTPLAFELTLKELSGYSTTSGGSQGEVVKGQAGEDGRFRICGLWPGDFRLIAGDVTSFGYTSVSIANSDVHRVDIDARSLVNIRGEIDWDTSESSFAGRKVTLRFTPVNRRLLEGEQPFSYSMEVAVPSAFNIRLPAATEYLVSLRGGGLTAIAPLDDGYLKAVACDGTAHGKTFDSGQAGCRLQLTVGTDVGAITASVTDKDKDDMPVPNATACVIPVSAGTREEISLESRCTTTDQNGSISFHVPAGKYFAIVQPPTVAEWVEYAWNERTRGQAVDAVKGGSAQVALKSVTK